MSISNPRLENPCKKFIEFKSDKGEFSFFDKELSEHGENVTIPLPIYFVVLDELSTIAGYCEQTKSGLYSNEVHSTVDEILRVKSFKGTVSIVGKYNDIKNEVKALGGKFCKSVYAILITGKDTVELVNFKFKGASFSAWLDKKINTQEKGVVVKELVVGTKGKTVYKVPVFTALNISDEIYKMALDIDKKLQEYLKSYKSTQEEQQTETATYTDVTHEIPEYSDEYVETELAKVKSEATNRSKDLEENSDLPF